MERGLLYDKRKLSESRLKDVRMKRIFYRNLILFIFESSNPDSEKRFIFFENNSPTCHSAKNPFYSLEKFAFIPKNKFTKLPNRFFAE
jgi:hypothetical protein